MDDAELRDAVLGRDDGHPGSWESATGGRATIGYTDQSGGKRAALQALARLPEARRIPGAFDWADDSAAPGLGVGVVAAQPLAPRTAAVRVRRGEPARQNRPGGIGRCRFTLFNLYFDSRGKYDTRI